MWIFIKVGQPSDPMRFKIIIIIIILFSFFVTGMSTVLDEDRRGLRVQMKSHRSTERVMVTLQVYPAPVPSY